MVADALGASDAAVFWAVRVWACGTEPHTRWAILSEELFGSSTMCVRSEGERELATSYRVMALLCRGKEGGYVGLKFGDSRGSLPARPPAASTESRVRDARHHARWRLARLVAGARVGRAGWSRAQAFAADPAR